MTEYDVRLHKIEPYRGARGTSYAVRWKVGTRRHRKTFRTAAQADGYRSELLAATRRGDAFDAVTGEPIAWARRRQQEVSWYDLACQFVDMKWRDVSPRYRVDLARALAAATPAMYNGSLSSKPNDKMLRRVMSNYLFNSRRRESVPEDLGAAAVWLATSTYPVSRLAEDPVLVRSLFVTATSRLDGTPAAPDTVRKHKMILNSVLDYAVELRLLPTNPGRGIKLTTTKASTEVDLRCVINHAQARRLLKAVGEIPTNGPRLVAFFGLLYYAGLRPEEALVLRNRNIVLPARDTYWGELSLEAATTHVGTAWTNSGESREERSLKQRADGQSRPVPVVPPLVPMLRKHLDEFTEGPDGRLFYGARSGREINATLYQRVWAKARESAFTPAEQRSPLARRPYDLRHACVSTWLAAGTPAPEVAAWAGHSVDVLLRRYAKCIDGQTDAIRRRIEQALTS
ncbi:MAG: tyrosine-type recombinase/integrase [Nocardioides sp.]